MANISDYLEEALLNHVFRNTEYTRPTTVYCGIVDDTAVETTDLEEHTTGAVTGEIVAYTGERKAITFAAPTQIGGKATIKNDDGGGGGEIEFDNMPSVNVKYIIVCDTATLGNILYWLPVVDHLGSPITKTAVAGDTFRIPAEELVLDLD